jgi:AcrR family transcriptional regulator
MGRVGQPQSGVNFRCRINEFNIGGGDNVGVSAAAAELAGNRGGVYSVYVVAVYTVDMGRISTAGRISSAAGKLLDLEGAEAVTMRRVAKGVGITPMAVYRHYADRDGLLNALADGGFAELAARLKSTRMPVEAEARVMKTVDVFLDFALEKPRLFELMFLRRREGARRFPEDFRAGKSPTANFAAASFEAGMRDGIFREDDAWEMTFETGALIQGLAMLYVGGRVGLSEKEFRALCHRTFRRYFHGIRR